MTLNDDWQAPTTPEPAPEAVPDPPRKRRGLWIAAGAVVGVIVIAAIIIAAVTGGETKQDTVKGTVAILDTSSIADVQGGCEGTDGYDDLTQGASVVVSDDTGKTLAITSLGQGLRVSSAGNICIFSFTTKVPAGKKFYGVTVTHRGTIKEQESDLGSVDLTIGSITGS